MLSEEYSRVFLFIGSRGLFGEKTSVSKRRRANLEFNQESLFCLGRRFESGSLLALMLQLLCL